MTEVGASFSKIVADRVVEILDTDGNPVAGVGMARIASNGTYIVGVTAEDGRWSFTEVFLGTTTVLAAAEGWGGAFKVLEDADWTSPLPLQMEALHGGGSIIFERGTGEVPGLQGRLNPIRDMHGRTYIYGDNISFEDSAEQPYQFLPGAGFMATDAAGNVFELIVLVILGRTSLICYRQVQESPLPSRPN
jgi:hypothetical protein